MPQNTYRVTDPSSGRVVRLTGESPPTEAELEQVFASLPPAATTPRTPATATSETNPLLEFGKGVLKAPAAIATSLGQAVHHLPFVSSAVDALYGTPGLSQASFPAIQEDLKGKNTAQTVGRIAGDIATAFVPAGAVTRGAKALATMAPWGGRALTRGAVEAAGAGGIAAAQGHDPTLPALAGGAIGAVSHGVSAGRNAFRNPNPVERHALEYVAQAGVPVDAGTMSGNAVLKGARYLADRTLAGSPIASHAARQEARGLSTLGERLASRASSLSQTPETAGEAITGAVSKRVTTFHDEANAAYDRLRALEPANTQPITVGYRPSPSGLVKEATPIVEPMAFPVDLQPVKDALRPVWDRMRRQMPVTQQEASPGLKAIQNIMEGPDIAPASIVDLDLSAIKGIARQADRPELRDVGQGLAAGAVTQLDAAVRAAVSRGGPQATAALMQGRKATVGKYLAAEVFESLRAEPVKAFRQATEPRDAAISQLRELHRLAPAEMPKLARAYVEDLLSSATKEGGFGGAQGIAKKWTDLGPETKKILFTDPTLVAELDRFFLAAKRLAENPNPSGSGGMIQMGSQGALLWYDPVTFGAVQLTGAVLATALRSPKVVRLLTAGMSAKPQSLTGRMLHASLAPILGQEKE